MNYYSIPEMASTLDVCRETVLKYIREKGFKLRNNITPGWFPNSAGEKHGSEQKPTEVAEQGN